jgi:hypothetical protein
MTKVTTLHHNTVCSPTATAHNAAMFWYTFLWVMYIPYLHVYKLHWSLGSSVSIVSDYRLDDRDSIPDRGRGFFSSLCVQSSSGAHPASCTMGTGGLFPWVKHGRGMMLTTHPHLVLRLRMSRSYTSSPPSAFMACSGTALLFL